MKLNGQLDGIIETVKRFWLVGVGLTVLVTWIFTVNQSVRHQGAVEKKLDDISLVQVENSVTLTKIQKFERDSLVTDKDMNFLMAQSLATHRMLDNRLRRLEHRPVQEGMGRWGYYPQYGPIPDKYRLWFEPLPQTDWLEAKAGGS